MTRAHAFPKERALDLWADGMTAPQIVDAIGPVGGIKFQSVTVMDCLRKARDAGDPRAARRNRRKAEAAA